MHNDGRNDEIINESKLIKWCSLPFPHIGERDPGMSFPSVQELGNNVPGSRSPICGNGRNTWNLGLINNY